VAVERAHEDANLRNGTRNVYGSVHTAAIDDHDIPRPAQVFERPTDVRFFIEGEKDRGDLVEHGKFKRVY
jgi:hypothetical protein